MTTELKRSRSAGKRRNWVFFAMSWDSIRTNSSYTSEQHLRLGSSRRRICCFTMTSKADVVTNRAGDDPDELYRIVRISVSFTESNGSMLLTPLLNSSWNTKLMRAPPASSFTLRSLLLPSITCRKSLQKSVMIVSTALLAFASPIAPPNDANSSSNFFSCAWIRVLMSGSVLRIWCMRIVLSLRARNGVPQNCALEL